MSDASEVPEKQASDAPPSGVCTRVCTSEGKNANEAAGPNVEAPSTASLPNADTLAALAAVLTGLDPTARATLVAMLLGAQR